MKFNIYLITLFFLTQAAIADELIISKPEESPKIIFNWPSVKTESVKYHLQNRFINSKTYEFPILIKEWNSVELINGREGKKSKITLELWKLNASSLEKIIWSISQEADDWETHNWEEVVLIKYGCCGSLNEYSFYNFKTGKLNRRIESSEIPK